MQPKTSEAPAGVEARWDLDGLSATLPGAGLTARDSVATLGWLGGGLALFTLVSLVVTAAMQGTLGQPDVMAMIVGAPVCVVAGIVPFLVLGGLRARGTPVHVRVEPNGLIRHQWMADEWTTPLQNLRAVHVPESGRARLELELEIEGRRVTQPWAMRDREVAAWLADQLRIAMAMRAEREGTAEDAPAHLRAMQPDYASKR